MDTRNLVFAINGERFELAGFDPATTLLEFLRTRTSFKGAKLGCGKGGCGACVVILSKYDPVSGEIEDLSVNSCLTLLGSIHLCSVTTTEGLGNSKNGFHAVQKRIAGFHGSQCGFCTPGVCISIFSALLNADKSSVAAAPPGFSNLPAAAAESAISGNLCRCTGYRSIVDSCKSFCADVDLEDLGVNSFWRRGGAAANLLPSYSPASVCTFPDFLKSELHAAMISPSILENLNSWRAPRSLEELQNLKLSPETRIKLVAGNTSAGIYDETDSYDNYVDLRRIPELNQMKSGGGYLEIGAAVTISAAIEALEKSGNTVFLKLAEHMKKVAAQFVRNTASIGGNLIMAQRGNFPSDIATILLAVDAIVAVVVNLQITELSLEEFFEQPPLDQGKILVSVKIPNWVNTDVATKSSFDSFRAAPRRLGNAVSYVNAAFLVRVNAEVNVESSRLVFGAYGVSHATRARKVEDFILGKKVNADLILQAIRLLREVIVPEEGTAHSEYRVSVAAGFLFKFLLQLEEEHGADLLKSQREDRANRKSSIFSTVFQNHQENGSSEREKRPVSRQEIEEGVDFHPVGQAVKKVGAELQASGEAVYVDDIPSPPGCLHGAFVYGSKPSGQVKEVKVNAKEKPIAIITAADIPPSGLNVGSGSIFGNDPLFGTDSAGQPLGLVLAETQRTANVYAKKAEIVYENGGTDILLPIMSVEEAVEKSSFFEVPPFLLPPREIGDFNAGIKEADQKILAAEMVIGSQYYFYMETQTALAVPEEDGCIVLYGSLQSPEQTQTIIAKCLGIPRHHVRVITRRLGGGFGGKALRSIPVATACALAAFKLRRPVRMYLDRKTDMVIAGGRHPMKVTYSVWFKNTGKITALELKILVNAGCSADLSPIMPKNMSGTLKKYNWGSIFMDFKVCKTNLPTKSAMRAPGDLQGNFIAEAIMEHVAAVIGIDPEVIRKVNSHSFESLKKFYGPEAGELPDFNLPVVIEKVAAAAEWQRRREEVNEYNCRHRWTKRGISLVPILMPVTIKTTPAKVGILGDGSIIVEVGGVELGQGLWTKAAQMAAYALGQLFDGDVDLLKKVKVLQADTLSLIQGGFTSGSTTSESSCEAVRLACNELVARLLPLKEGSLSWERLIRQAELRSVNLSSSVLFNPGRENSTYVNYGAAISEVEIDLLTGATTILRSDLVYDGGRSLNPAVDLGQIEGSFVQGIGFFMYEEYLSNSDGLVTSDGTWTYKIPTVDTIPRQFNVELLSSGQNQHRVLSSKASGEPPLLMAVSVHCATRAAIRAARKELSLMAGAVASRDVFHLDAPATMPVVKKLCGYDNVERHLTAALSAGEDSIPS